MNSTNIHKKFERLVFGGLSEERYYSQPQSAPVLDEGKCEVMGTFIYDFANSRTIYLSYVDGTVTIDKERVFPADNKDMFELTVTNDNEQTRIKHTGTELYLNGTRVYPKNELK